MNVALRPTLERLSQKPIVRRWFLLFGLTTVAFVISLPTILFAARETLHSRNLRRLEIIVAAPPSVPRHVTPDRDENAWDYYMKATESLMLLSPRDVQQVEVLATAKTGPLTPAEFRKTVTLLDKGASAVEQVRKGTRCRRAQAARFEPGSVSIGKLHLAVSFLVARARLEWAGGNHGAALDNLGDALQLTADIVMIPGRYSGWIASLRFRSLLLFLEQILAGPLTDEEASRLGTWLESTEASLHGADWRLLEEARFHANLTSDESSKWWSQRRHARKRAFFRYGFSIPAAADEMVEFMLDEVELIKKVERFPWSLASKEYGKFQAMVTSARNPLADGLVGTLDRTFRIWRARVQLLRAALCLRRGGTENSADWPADPISLGPVKRRLDKDVTVLWCSGINGDSGGKGEFDPEKWKEDLDIVLRVRSK